MSYIPKKNNLTKNLQYELFESNDFFAMSSQHNQEFNHSRSSLIQWRKNVNEYQNKVIENIHNPNSQSSLFKIDDNLDIKKIILFY